MLDNKIKLNLQLFAEDGEGADGVANEGGASQNGAEDGVQGSDNQGITLTSEQLSAQINQAVQQAVQAATAEAQTEAQRLAKMSDDERAEHERKKQDEALAKRELEITRRELKVEAVNQLTERELPVSLVDLVVLDSAEACTDSIASIEKSFKEAVEKEVEKRLGESAYVPGSGGKQKQKAGSFGANLAKNSQPKETKESSYFK